MNYTTGNIDQYTPISKKNNKYIVNWGLKDNGNSTGEWYYFIEDKKPSRYQIEQKIKEYVNDLIKDSIQNKFRWNGMKIDLAIEDQLDLSLLFNITLLQDGENLPETIKVKQNGETIYYQIETLDEFKDLIVAMNKHIRNCLKQSHELKDSIDYSLYE